MPAFIVCDHESTGSRIRDVLGFGGRPSPRSLALSEAVPRLSGETDVDLVVLALSGDPERGLSTAPHLAKTARGRLLVVGPTGDSKLVLRCCGRARRTSSMRPTWKSSWRPPSAGWPTAPPNRPSRAGS